MRMTFSHCITHTGIRNYEVPDNIVLLDKIQAKGGCLARFWHYGDTAIIKWYASKLP